MKKHLSRGKNHLDPYTVFSQINNTCRDKIILSLGTVALHSFRTYLFGILNKSLNVEMSEFWVSCHETLLVRLHVTHLNRFQLFKLEDFAGSA